MTICERHLLGLFPAHILSTRSRAVELVEQLVVRAQEPRVDGVLEEDGQAAAHRAVAAKNRSHASGSLGPRQELERYRARSVAR